jgi:hypothetical protein
MVRLCGAATPKFMRMLIMMASIMSASLNRALGVTESEIPRGIFGGMVAGLPKGLKG